MRAALIGLALYSATGLAALGGMTAAPALAAPTSIALPSGKYVLDPTHASLTWRVVHFGLSNYTARFAKFDATVDLNAADVSKSSLKVKVDPTSVRTDYPYPDKVNFDAEVGTSPKFLDGTAHPDVTFVSTGIVVTGPKTANITGNLTLRGVTKPVTLAATLNGSIPAHPMTKLPVFGISAKGSFKRSDFGMDYGTQFVSDTVELAIEAEFNKAP
ncbi:MAG TPA: YceI family protein [Polymorphobacter sp.]|nr:YceI family protein [Polymorphobacter sp.]